jgi:putative membrane protein
MLHLDKDFATAVETVVGKIETKTDAEVVVVAAPRSGSYRDLALLVGAAAAWLTLVFVILSPFHFSGDWLPVEVPLVGLVFAWLADRSPGLLGRLAKRARQREQVLHAAHAIFHEEAVHGTKRRNAVLVYVSALENRVELLADSGLEAVMPLAELHTLRFGTATDPHAPGTLDEFVAGLRLLGERLARYAPAVEGDNDNVIPNAPRVRA